jgi:hypothetical protein
MFWSLLTLPLAVDPAILDTAATVLAAAGAMPEMLMERSSMAMDKCQVLGISELFHAFHRAKAHEGENCHGWHEKIRKETKRKLALMFEVSFGKQHALKIKNHENLTAKSAK